MPLIAMSDLPVSIASARSFFQERMQIRQTADVFDLDVTRSTIDRLNVGNVSYPLREPLKAIFIPGRGEFLVDGLSPPFVGRGATQQTAFLDWRDNLHYKFQELISARPFEMNDADVRTWNILSDHIDIAVYRNQVPIQVAQFGKVTKVRPYPCEITWENGQCDTISLDQVRSPDFVTFKAGQPLEAVIARDPITFDLVAILHIERRKTPSRLGINEEVALLSEIGSNSVLKESDWD
jgi:hypothetical protein